jgi:hypothetical protein
MHNHWQDVLKHPSLGDHIVQVYQDREFLAEAVAEYLGAGLRQGDAAIVIARPEHRAAFERELAAAGLDAAAAARSGQLIYFDAAQTLGKFMREGMPDWNAFRDLVGSVIAEARLQYPSVRAYGEMVDILWQEGNRDAATRLEEFWNELGTLQTFSLFCAYYMDNLDGQSYGGPLECVCKTHTHLIPARNYERFNAAVDAASREVLDAPLSNMLLSMSAAQRPQTDMPIGQATLLWLKQNMPRTADKVLDRVRASAAGAGAQ